jgi:hypothetical protein
MAARYFVSGGVDNNWGTTGNWATASGGVGGASIPSTADDVVFEAASPNCTVNTSNRVCKTIDFTAYTNTITMTFAITASGAITFGSGMNVSGTGSINTSVTSTITPNGYTWPNSFGFLSTGQTYTLASNMTIGGAMITGNGCTINGTGFKLFCTGITQGNTSVGSSGNITIELYGTGTWTGTAALGWGFNMIINCGAGTLTIAANRLFGFASLVPTFTYTSGTVNCSGQVVFFNCNINSSGMTFADVRFGGSGVAALPVTLLSNMDVSGNFIIQGNISLTATGFQVNISGNLTNNQVGVSSSGTTILNMVGTGIISTIGTPTGWALPITINTAGTITFSGSITYGGTLTYTAGTIVSTGATLNRPGGTMNINNSGFNLNILNITALSYFLGTNGFTISTLNCITAGIASVWKTGNEYIVINSILSGQADAVNRVTYTSSGNNIVVGSISGTTLTVTANTYGTVSLGHEVFCTGLSGGFTVSAFGTGTGSTGNYTLSGAPGTITSRNIVLSSNVGVYPKITLNPLASQNVYYSNAVDIDSSSGQTIWTFAGNILRAFNWNTGSQPTTFSYTWVT